MNMKKRLFSLIFLALFTSDVCSYIKVYIERPEAKIKTFNFLTTRFSDHFMIFNLSIIYFVFVSGIYFLINFFKKDKDNLF